MSIHIILVCLFSEETADASVAAACAIARRNGAHLVGLHVSQTILFVPSVAVYAPAPFIPIYNDEQEARAVALHKIFESHTQAEEFVSEWRHQKTDPSDARDRFLDNARAADLIILSQDDPTNKQHDSDAIRESLIRDSGRPVLVLPFGKAVSEIGNRVVIGWSATREAARAAHDAVPLMVPGAPVHILIVGRSEEADVTSRSTAHDLAASLARCGLKPEVVHRTSSGSTVAETLAQVAFETGADLIVTGAFGHSRFYDFIVGAATRELLKDMQKPVLFSK